MATTTYDYITLANLESLTGYDYSSIDATKFHDDKVNAMIGVAERMVNGYLGVSAAQTVTDGLYSAVILISAKILGQNLIEYGYALEGAVAEEVLSWSMREILSMFLDSDQTISVDSVPMSGADND